MVEGALPPPPGVVSNFINPPSQRPWFYATAAICLFFTTPFVLARLFTRIYVTRSPGWDDYTCFITWLGYLGYTVLYLEAAQRGAGVDAWNVTAPDALRVAQLANDGEILYGVLIFLAKLSLCLLYWRLFVPERARKGRTYVMIHILLWPNFFFYFIGVFIEVFTCVPRDKIWDPSVPGTCVNIFALIISQGFLNVLSDATMLILPIAKVWHLHMDRKRKISLSVIFALSLFVLISSIVRLVWSFQAASTLNQTLVIWQVCLWTNAELSSVLIVGCMPVMPALFRAMQSKNESKHPGTGPSSKKQSGTFKGRVFSHQITNSANKAFRPPMPNAQRAYMELEDGSNGIEMAPRTTTIVTGGPYGIPGDSIDNTSMIPVVQTTISVHSEPRDKDKQYILLPQTPALAANRR